jgi:hypothetical protein
MIMEFFRKEKEMRLIADLSEICATVVCQSVEKAEVLERIKRTE